MEEDYYTEWACGKCGRKLRAFFKAEAVRGAQFGEHTVMCPDCLESKSLIPEPYRLDREEESVWTTVWVK